ncbi:hypothetical protein ABIA30_002804 [Mycobacterium sp. MAA66]|uniref:hypothetical protein n=1 Tax=Mycobacterium sp. MAA66 TaxID=3156297 RepID=UPI0035143B82
MSTETESTTTPEARPKSSFRRTAAVVAVAAAIAGVGGAAIYAATDQPADGRHGPWHPPGPPPGGPAGKPATNAGPNALPDHSLHGEFVSPDPAGGYRTTLVQTGTITAVSPQSITARSDDGFTQTYVIPPAAAQGTLPFSVDQYVTVRATRDGQTVTVVNIGYASR